MIEPQSQDKILAVDPEMPARSAPLVCGSATGELASAVSSFFVKDMTAVLSASPINLLRNPRSAARKLLGAGFGVEIVSQLGEQSRKAALSHRRSVLRTAISERRGA